MVFASANVNRILPIHFLNDAMRSPLACIFQEIARTQMQTRPDSAVERTCVENLLGILIFDFFDHLLQVPLRPRVVFFLIEDCL